MAKDNMDLGILMVDIDEVTLPFPKDAYEAKAKKVLEFFGYEAIGFAYRLSNSKGIHITVWTYPDVEPMYKPLLQYLLGSDEKRECLNYFRYQKGVDIDVLFTTKKRLWNPDDAAVPQKITLIRNRFPQCVRRMEICKGLSRMIEIAKKMGIERIWPL